MNRASIASTLDRTQTFLQEDGRFLISESDLESLVARTEALLDKARQPGEALYVAIVGGTGVGKSTLINALAREEISHPSDRRPYTDRAVVYRHARIARGLEDLDPFMRDPDAEHEIDDIKDLVLLDLPDFDSVESANRHAVVEILPNMDCIIWVLSPEKYADAAFYNMIAHTAINMENFTFVLNKADELLPDGAADKHVRFKEILGDVSLRLKHDAEVPEPRIYCVSALHEFKSEKYDDVLEKEFQRFRDFLMVRRDAKEIAAIKTVNLIEQTADLIEDLHETVRPSDKSRVLNAVRNLQERHEIVDTGANLAWVDSKEQLASALLSNLLKEDGSVPVVRLAMRLIGLIRGTQRPESNRQLEETFRKVAMTTGAALQQDLEKLDAQIDSEFLLAFHPSATSASKPSPKQMVEHAVYEAAEALALGIEAFKRSMRGPFSRARRLWQRFVLLLPVLVLILRLAGETSVKGWLDAPSVAGALKIAVGFLMALFSPEALAGLAVLLVFEMLLVWFLASRRVRRLEKQSDQLAASGISFLQESMKNIAHEFHSDRMALVDRTEQGIRTLTELRDGFSAHHFNSSHP